MATTVYERQIRNIPEVLHDLYGNFMFYTSQALWEELLVFLIIESRVV